MKKKRETRTKKKKKRKKRTHKSSNVMSLNETSLLTFVLCGALPHLEKPKSKRMSNELHKLPWSVWPWPTNVWPILISFGPFRATNKMRILHLALEEEEKKEEKTMRLGRRKNIFQWVRKSGWFWMRSLSVRFYHFFSFGHIICCDADLEMIVSICVSKMPEDGICHQKTVEFKENLCVTFIKHFTLFFSSPFCCV